VRVSIASPLMQPSPNGRRVGIRIVTFEACSGFTHVTAHRIAQPPRATFVTTLQPFRSPGRAARQLPDQSTILWVDSSSTSDSRLRGALPIGDIREKERDRQLRRPLLDQFAKDALAVVNTQRLNLLQRIQNRQRLCAVLAHPIQCGDHGALPVNISHATGQVPLSLS
jgi:hypothetical protein